MTASVPQVTPISEIKYQLARLLEEALELRKLTGDSSHFINAVQLARRVYEEQIKPRRNLGQMDKAYVEQIRVGLEKVETIAARYQST